MIKGRRYIWLKFIVFLKPFWKQEILLVLLYIVGNLGALVSPLMLKIIIDKVIPASDLRLLFIIISVLFVVYIARIASKFAADYMFSWISNKVMFNITEQIYNHIIRLPLSFFRKTNNGDLLQRIGNEVGQLQNALTGSIISLFNNLITISILIVMLCLLHWQLFLSILFIYPLSIFVLKFFDPHISRLVKASHERESLLLGHFANRFLNIRSIKIFNAFDIERSLVRDELNKYTSLNVQSAKLASIAKNVSVFLLATVPLIVLGWGGAKLLLELLAWGRSLHSCSMQTSYMTPAKV